MSLAGETSDLGERAEERKQTWAIDLRREDWRGQSWSCNGVNDAPCLTASVVYGFSSFGQGGIHRCCMAYLMPYSSPVQSAGGNGLFFGRSFFCICPIFPALSESAISCPPFFAPWARRLWIGGAITSRSNSNQYFLACRFSFADGGGFMSALWLSPEIGLSAQE